MGKTHFCKELKKTHMESFLMNYNKCEENISVFKKNWNCNSFIHIKKAGLLRLADFRVLLKNSDKITDLV